MKFDICLETKENTPSDRVKTIMSDFDMTFEHTKEHFVGDIDIDGQEWSVGAIVGGSGTGKSTIAKKLFFGGGMCLIINTMVILLLMTCRPRQQLTTLNLHSLP